MLDGAMRRSDLPRIITEMNEVVDAAALRPDRWQEVADRLSACMSGAKVSLHMWDRGITHPYPLIVAGWSSKAIQDYGAYYRLINPWTQAWTEMPFMRAVWADSCLPVTELRKTECYADFLRIHAADSATGIKLIDQPDRLATFSLNYDSARGERTNSLAQPLIQGLAAGMRRAVDVNRSIFRSSSLPAETNLLAALVDPAFVVDGTCRLLAVNSSAQKLIADGSLLRVGARDIVRINDPQIGRIFSERIRRACDPSLLEGRASIDDLTLAHPSSSVTVTMMPVRQSLHSMSLSGVLPLFLPSTVALVVIRSRPKGTLGQELRARYGLTESEASVTLALLNSGTLAHVADSLGISYETVRSHLRSAFIKTGTNKQKQLVALVLNLGNRAEPPSHG